MAAKKDANPVKKTGKKIAVVKPAVKKASSAEKAPAKKAPVKQPPVKKKASSAKPVTAAGKDAASQEEVRVAVLGAGNRGRGVVWNLLRDSVRKVKVLSVYDPDMEQAKRAISADCWNYPDAKICASYQEAIAVPGVDWVMVFSPNAYHKEQILEGFRQGKDVFTEKPLATKIEDCEAIFEAHRKSGRKFATGFVLRYAPIYRKVKELLDSGVLGDIMSIDANENIDPHHGVYILCNWRRQTKYAGPHILEKCCHDLDLINWFCQSHVSKVAAFGGLDLFKPENRKMEKEFPGTFTRAWEDPHGVESAFTSDKDLMDNLVSAFEYRNGIRVMFQCTMSNAIPERRMYFTCTKGNLVVELYSSTLKYAVHGQNEVTIRFGMDGHGGGDSYIMKELYEGPMTTDALPTCSGSEGLESAVLALCIDKAAKSRKVVDVEPVWKKLNR